MKELTVVQINDLHGYMEPHKELFWKGEKAVFRQAGGLAQVKTLLNQIRKEEEAVLFLDGGDTIHGTYPTVDTQGEIMIPVLNNLGIDAMTSHWEFAYGPKRYLEVMDQLNYPSLAVNCYYEDTDNLVFPPYLIKEVGGVKVGIIGIAATIVDKVMPKHFSEGIYFTIGESETRDYVDKLKRENLDLIIVISHLGYPQDLEVAKKVDGIDVLLSAHTHNRVYKPAIISNTLVIQSGCHGSFLGKLDLLIEDKKVQDYKYSLLEVANNIIPDLEMDYMINDSLDGYRDYLNQEIGYTEVDLHRYGVLESTMDNFLLDSMISLTGAELAFSNGWRYGAPITKGIVTMNDLWNVIPTNPYISTTDITGREVWDMMEENLERTFSRNPYKQMGGYIKRVANLQMYFKIENPEGQRLQELFIKNKPLVDDKVYRAVFVTTQGVPKKYGENRTKTEYKAINNLERHLKSKGKVKPMLKNHIIPI